MAIVQAAVEGEFGSLGYSHNDVSVELLDERFPALSFASPSRPEDGQIVTSIAHNLRTFFRAISIHLSDLQDHQFFSAANHSDRNRTPIACAAHIFRFDPSLRWRQ
jgi:hypothetical protein